MISISGVRIVLTLWLSHYRAIRYKPPAASLRQALDPLESQVFFDMIRKTLKSVGLHFYRLVHKTGVYCYASMPLGSGVLIFDWDDRAQVLTMIKETWQDKIYSEPPAGLTVDVGANVGVYSLYACARASVLAIEPFRKNWDFLKLNSKGHNILPFNLAIARTDGYRRLFLSDLTASCSFETAGLSGESVRVKTERLDTFLNSEKVANVDTLKIDTEGAEMEILESAGRYLDDRKIRRVIVASYHYQTEAQAVQAFLLARGYRVVVNRTPEVIVYGLAMAT